MCFLTYICNYLFLFHTLFYYKKRRLCLPFDGSFALSSLWKRVNTWSSFADLYVVLLYKAFCQTVVRTALPRHDLCTICYPILLLAKQYYRMKTVRVILCQYYQGNIHIHFFSTHLSKTNSATASSIPWTGFVPIAWLSAIKSCTRFSNLFAWCKAWPKATKVSEYDQEIPQSHIAGQTKALRGRQR